MIDRQIDGVRQVTGSVSSDELKPSGLCCNQSQTGTVGSYSGVLQILLRGLTDLTPGSYRSYSGVLQILLRGLANLTPSDSPFKNKIFCLIIFLWFFNIFTIDFDGYHIVELTRVNPDKNIFSIKCGTNIYFIYSIKVWSIIITEF